VLKNSVRLFTVGGIEVGVHYSWLIVFGLLTWSLATSMFPGLYRELTGERLPAGIAWILGAAAALLLFASVLIHELAHSFVARARGLEARSITLFIFGGVSNLSAESKSPATEFLVAVVGPLTSFGLAGVAFIGALLVDQPHAAIVLNYLWFVNLLLGGFNLVPGFPLDGGRVLRSIVWKVTNSLRRATEIAAGAGQLIGFLFILWGISTLFNGGNNLIGGLWIAAIGWFLQTAATSSLQQVILETRLRNVRVSSVVRREPTAVTPETSVAELVDKYLLPGNRRAMPVADGDKLVGMVTLGDIKDVPPDQRTRVTVGQVMGGRDGLLTIRPADTLSTAVERITERDLEQLPVVEDGQLIGVLTRADLMRQLQLRETLDVGGVR
jgi:Zn-dependent protease/CBS domain-containing protein